ncbi:MAG: helix-turn-helix transcriptional regulator, partial [Chloroflexota bacterium]
MNADHRHGHHHDQHGWVRPGGRRGRWLEPFLLLLVGEGETHGYALIGRLNALGVAPEGVDVGMAYRTLRELEAEGLVLSAWVTEGGAPRREYHLTPEGR